MSKNPTFVNIKDIPLVIKTTFDNFNNDSREELLKTQEFFNKHHNKLAPVNVVRESFHVLRTLLNSQNNKVKFIKDDSKLIEQYTISVGNTELAFTVKTYTPTSVITNDAVQNHTIVQLNQSVEKAKKYFGTDTMVLIRTLCHNLVSSATDHRLDCWVESGEFSFRFSVPQAKLNIEILVLN